MKSDEYLKCGLLFPQKDRNARKVVSDREKKEDDNEAEQKNRPEI